MSAKRTNKQFIVGQPCELLAFLNTSLAPMSAKDIKALLAHSSILVDGKIRTQYNHKLHKGQIVSTDYQNKAQFLQNENIELIYEDTQLLVINKPHGLVVTPTEGEARDGVKEKTALGLMNAYVKLSDPKNAVHIVHRIDKETSGILLFSLDKDLARQLQNDWNDIVTERLYYAVVEGVLEEKSQEIVQYLKQDANNMVYASKSQYGDRAVTAYTVLKKNGAYSLLDVAITTGRKNQIRVCMRDLGHSIVGDKKYGGKSSAIKRMGLHAYKLSLSHPETGEKLSFECKIPKEFNRLLT